MTRFLSLIYRDGDLTDLGMFLVGEAVVAAWLLKIGGVF